MSNLLLAVHISGALVALVFAILGVRFALKKDGRVVFYSLIPRSSASGLDANGEGGWGNGSFPNEESSERVYEASVENRGFSKKSARLIPRQLATGIGRADFYSRFLSTIFIVNSLSGLALAASTNTPVLSICDNLAVYTLLFACVQGFVFVRMRSEKILVSLAPLYWGVGVTGALTAFALLIGL